MNLKTIKVLLFTLLALTLASFLIGCGVSKPVYFLFTALFAIGYAAVWLLCWRCPFCGRHLFYKMFQLNPDLLLCTNIHCQCIHAHCIQVCKKSKSDILFNLGNSYMITIFCKRLCLFLCRLFLIINQNLVIKCLFITEDKRHLRHT